MTPFVQPEGGFMPKDYADANNARNAEVVGYYNKARAERYNAACDNAQISIDAGRGDTATWPNVPNAMALGHEDEFGIQWPVETNTPACPARFPVHKPQQPSGTGIVFDGTVDIGADLGGGWFAAGPQDKASPGTVVETPLGKLRKVGAPVGNGWWMRVPITA